MDGNIEWEKKRKKNIKLNEDKFGPVIFCSTTNKKKREEKREEEGREGGRRRKGKKIVWANGIIIWKISFIYCFLNEPKKKRGKEWERKGGGVERGERKRKREWKK